MKPSAVDMLLAELAGRGIQLQAHGDRLRFRPQAAMTPDLLARLTTHKPTVLAVLTDLAERLDSLNSHVAVRPANQAWCEEWDRRLQVAGGWQHPIDVARAVIEDYATSAAATGDVKRFCQWDSYVRSELLEADDWEQRCLRAGEFWKRLDAAEELRNILDSGASNPYT
jgi:hypothetical protein